MAVLSIPTIEVARFIRALADTHCAQSTEAKLDELAQVITRLGGDDVRLNDVEILLVRLRRRRIITGSEMMILHSRYFKASVSEGS